MNLLEIGKQIGIEGFLHCDEAHKLVELAAGRDVLEVGAFMGLSAWLMGISAKTVTSVDTFRANTAGQVQLQEITTLQAYQYSISRYRHITYFVGTSVEAHAQYTGDGFDMIFIDAFHDYENVKEDTNRWIKHLRPGGIFAWHDYGHDHFPGVKKAVDEFLGRPIDSPVGTLAWVTKT